MKSAVRWSDEAEQSLREVPFFVRPAVRRRIESLASEAGLQEVDADFYRQARDSFGRKVDGDGVKG
ncbi:MAG: PCP reductase family protein [Cyanobium sp.]